jgi:phosphoribosylamine--glycine ligase
MSKVEERIIKPTIRGLQDDKIPYTGFVFFGLMNVGGDPYVIEYNVRMGDPETEAVMPRISNDLLPVLAEACDGRLDKEVLLISPASSATVVCVSQGYPEAYSKGRKIKISQNPESLIFHSGTRLSNGELLTNGGRVFAVTSVAENMQECLEASYRQAAAIEFEGKYFRRDIGQDLMSETV